MRKPITLAAVLCSISVTGCATGAAGDGSVTDTFGYSFHSELAAWQSEFPFHEAIAYHDHGVSFEDAQAWHDAKVPYEQAIKWHSLGFTPDDAKLAVDSGITNPDSVVPWYYKIVPLYPQDKPSPSLLVSYVSNAGTTYTPDDVVSVLQNTSAPVSNVNEVIALARRAHTGEAVGKLAGDLSEMRAEDAKWRIAADKAAKEQQRQAWVDKYSAPILAACHNNITPMNILMFYGNPYSTKGKCVEAPIRAMWGTTQWLNEHSLLVLEAMPGGGETQSSIVTDPDGALRMGANAVLMGVDPTPYTSVLGAHTIAPTFIVLKYLD